MAAKVAMLAVPTVFGIASVRVYTVREQQTNLQSTREQLNVYTPLLQSTQTHGASEQHGVIENSITTARRGVVPVVQAVKGAYVSLKEGSVNLYYTGLDVYYYLKDPPPGFPPRFGTITMAGLLGMFLARNGSRLKRLTLPLGLMSAGATVCYPTQAVAVCKITGKTVYAAGQWSSSTISSLFTPKPATPGPTETEARQPSEVPNTAVVEEAQSASHHTSELSTTLEEPTQCTKIFQKEASDLPPASPELIIPVTEEASLAVSPDQTPTDALPAAAKTESSCAGVEVTGESCSLSSDEAMINFDPETGEVALAEPLTLKQLEGDTGFKPDPALMDFGQSNPDDKDLYSTRS